MSIDKEEFDEYSIEQKQKGPSGRVFYSEQGRALDFYWEYIVKGVSVTVPPPREWDTFCESHGTPWAKGRRDEILGRIGEFYVRRFSKGWFERLFRIKVKSSYEIEDRWLTIRYQ